MAKNVEINEIVYNSVPSVKIPLANGTGDALFVDTSDATMTSGGQSLDGVTSYASGVKITGSIPTKTAADMTASGATVTAPAGYYAAATSKTIASGTATTPATSINAVPVLSINASTGVITGTVSASQNVTPTVSAGYVSAGTAGTISVSGSDTLALTVQAAQTITPGTTAQTIAAGQYLTGAQTIAGDANLIGQNIKAGVSIFNVDGELSTPVVSQDSVTKVLSIS